MKIQISTSATKKQISNAKLLFGSKGESIVKKLEDLSKQKLLETHQVDQFLVFLKKATQEEVERTKTSASGKKAIAAFKKVAAAKTPVAVFAALRAAKNPTGIAKIANQTLASKATRAVEKAEKSKQVRKPVKEIPRSGPKRRPAQKVPNNSFSNKSELSTYLAGVAKETGLNFDADTWNKARGSAPEAKPVKYGKLELATIALSNTQSLVVGKTRYTKLWGAWLISSKTKKVDAVLSNQGKTISFKTPAALIASATHQASARPVADEDLYLFSEASTHFSESRDGPDGHGGHDLSAYIDIAPELKRRAMPRVKKVVDLLEAEYGFPIKVYDTYRAYAPSINVSLSVDLTGIPNNLSREQLKFLRDMSTRMKSVINSCRKVGQKVPPISGEQTFPE